MATQLAVDISNYQGNLSQQTFERWRAEGVRTVICGTDGSQQFPVAFPGQVERARTAGLAVEAYVYLYFSQGTDGVVRRTNLKLDMVDQAGGIRRVWLDCEDTTSGLPPATLVGIIAAARDAVLARGYECGIYTGRWWWEPYTANDRGFWDRPLWLAQYNGVQTLDMEPLGGWTELHRKQYTDKGALGGVSPLDLNIERVPEVVPASSTGGTTTGAPASAATAPSRPIDIAGALADLRSALAKLGGDAT
ncbi:MAG: glycoside hydrolase family 25 protein [Dehalococcoidia bacterium]